MKKILSILLVLSILLSLSASAFSVDYLISDGLTYRETTETLPDGNMSHEYLFRFTPHLSTRPVVAFGESQFSRKNLLKIANTFGDSAVAGINADFFSFTTGIPLGAVAVNGRFLSSSVGNNALAIFEDGTLHIGKPDIVTKISFEGEEFDFYYNKYPLVYSLYVTDNTFSDSTESNFECLEILLKPRREELYINSTVSCLVKNISFNTTDTKIKKGHFVLTVPNTHPAYKLFSTLHIGESVNISVTASKVWEDASYVVGGGDIIVEDGVYIPETADEYADKVRYARTAVGITEEGEGIFFAVNGKKENYSSGLTYAELAEEMIKEGAKTVLNLDGGGSTTVGVKFPGDTEMKVMNYPTDGYPRGIANAILFVNTKNPSGKISNATLLSSSVFAMSGAETLLKESFFDSSMTAVTDTEGIEREYVALTEGIEITDGKLKVVADSGEVKVGGNYFLPDGREINAEKTLYIPEALDNLTLELEKDVLLFSDKTRLTISADFYGFDVLTSVSAFDWQFEENNKTELGEGMLAENDVARLWSDGTLEVITEHKFVTTTLVASYRGKTAKATLFVGLEDALIDGFELLDDDSEKGYKSERALTLPKGSVAFDEPLATEHFPYSFTLMYKGEFDDEADLLITTSEGEETSVPYTVVSDYSGVTGWSKIEAVIPRELKGKVFIVSPFTSKNEKPAVIDDFTVTYGVKEEYFSDALDSWAKDYIDAIRQMEITEGYLTDEGIRLFDPAREITRAEFAKFITLFKNLSYEGSEPSFADSDLIPEWSKPYVNAVSSNGIMNGRREGDGLYFAPNEKITRAEIMVVISRLIETSDGDEPSFADFEEIPDWAKEGVKASVSSGIITGYPDNTVRASNNITRAETAVVLTRLYDYLFRREIDASEE